MHLKYSWINILVDNTESSWLIGGYTSMFDSNELW